MSVVSLLSRLKQLGIGLQLIDDQLKITVSKTKLDPFLLEELKEKKPEIIAFLQAVRFREDELGIKPVEKREYYPVSSAQKRIYLVQHMNLHSTAYNIPMTMPVSFDPHRDNKKEKLANLFNRLIMRHESLRTCFREVREELVQVVQDNVEVRIEVFTQEDQPELFFRPFDLSKAPLLRVGIKCSSRGKYHLMMDMHHIISDDVSLQLLRQEFLAQYAGESLAPLQIQYKDFSGWQNSSHWKTKIKKQEEYWLKNLRDPVILELPCDFPRPPVQDFSGNSVLFSVEEDEIQRLIENAKTAEATLYMVFTAIFNVLLSRLGGQEDIIIGMPIEGRRYLRRQPIIGMFVNTLVLRNYPSREKNLTDFLLEVKQSATAAHENQDYPFEVMVNQLSLHRDTSRNPLFDVMFNWMTASDDQNRVPGERKKEKIPPSSKHIKGTVKFDLSLRAFDAGNRVIFQMEYCSKLFKPQTIDQIIGYFKSITSDISQYPHKTIKEIEVISEARKKEILEDFNKDLHDPSVQGTLQDKFIENFNCHRDRIALQYDDYQITYSKLDKHSTSASNWLILHKIEKNQLIGVYLDNKIHLITLMIGILKAGGVFVPIDTVLPVKRVREMLEKTAMPFIFTTTAHKERFQATCGEPMPGVEFFPVDDSFYREYLVSGQDRIRTYNRDDTVYIYFTSGTTGTPEAFAGKNSSLLHFINWEIRKFNITPGFRVSQLSAVGFDAFLRNIFTPICAGGTVCIPKNPELTLDNLALINWVRKQHIELLQCVPAIFKLFNTHSLKSGYFKSLKYITLSGDVVVPYDVEKCYNTWGQRIQLVNYYGTSETTLAKFFHFISREDAQKTRIPVGKPMQGASVIILDQNLGICDLGIVGEIYIRTPYRTLGYYNNPRLNQEKFISNPFSNNPLDLVHRTGDMGRLLWDGTLEYLGRKDGQVKIRGNRIELGEIETRLKKYPGIIDVVTAIKNISREAYLCAYIVANGDVTAAGLREYLSRELPAYMIPVYFITIEKIPLTPNGKFDLKALPLPQPQESKSDYIAPRDEIEKELVEICAGVLNIKPGNISMDDNFFQLGGHSLNAMTVIAKIHRQMNVRVPLVEILRNPDVKTLANYTRQAVQDQYISITSTEKKEYYRISSPQKRMYFLQQLEKESTTYNIPLVLQLEKAPDWERLAVVFQEIIQRHESLRTSFHMLHETPVQKIHEHVDFVIESYSSDFQSKEEVQKIISEFFRPFDLSRAPLIRVGIINTGKEEGTCILMAEMNHIISDAVSSQVLEQDFAVLYREPGKVLPDLRLQYKDYAEWQTSRKANKSIQQQQIHWMKIFSGEIPVLHLPTDFPRPAQQSFAGNTLHFQLNQEQTRSLERMAKQQEATLFMVLFALYNVVLYRISGQEDIVVGIPVAGRRHNDLEKIIGMFVNTLAVRNFPTGEKSFPRFLKEIKEVVTAAFENQEYPLEDLLEKVKIERDLGRNPLFDVIFNLLNVELPKAAKSPPRPPHSRPRVKPYGFERKTSKFDISFIVSPGRERLFFNLEYCSKLFKRETMYRLIRYFKNAVAAVLENEHLTIAGIDIIPVDEKQQLLADFNDTTAEYPGNKTIHQLFARQVKRTPDHTALVLEQIPKSKSRIPNQAAPQAFMRDNISITYREVHEKSNQLAYLLIEKGVQVDSIVGIMLQRSSGMVIGILSILKAGGAYLPIDPGYPQERIRYMLADSNTRILLTTSRFKVKVKAEIKGGLIETIDIFNLSSFSTSTSTLTCQVSPTNLAYVIYTSGSTGKPKGVELEHRPVINRLHWMQKAYPIAERDVLIQKTPYTFDVSVWELFWWGFQGASLFLLGVGQEKDPDAIREAVERHQVTTIHFVPSMLQAFLDFLETAPQRSTSLMPSLRQIFASGEELTPLQVERFNRLIFTQQQKSRLINLYGPTEAAVDVTYFNCPPGEMIDRVPIGKPIDNIRLVIVDRALGLLPPGVIGELCISGVGLARGYLNQPALTAEKFIHLNGFVKVLTAPNSPYITHHSSCLYRTGDLSRWLPDGNIEYRGRIDLQVKIRGFRIELGEIQERLEMHVKIKKAVVVIQEKRNGDRSLLAYWVSEFPEGNENNLSQEDLKKFLSDSLPAYMVPTHFIQLSRIPLTPSGKIDKKNLPLPESVERQQSCEAPQNEIERKMVVLWSEVLGIEKIGINDNFFEVGGDSIKIIQISARLQKYGLKVDIGDFFKAPTIKRLSKLVKKIERNIYQGIVTGQVELTPVQKWFFESYGIDNSLDFTAVRHFNQSVMLYREEGFEEDILYQVFTQILRHHDALRMVYRIKEGTIIQRNRGIEEPLFDLESHNLQEMDHGVKNQIHQAVNRIQRGINLETGPLVRLGLFKTRRGDHLLIVIHHLTVDGISWRILLEDFQQGYQQVLQGLPLKSPDKTDSFQYWSEKLREYARGSVALKHLEYWKALKKTNVDPLPVNHPLPHEKQRQQDLSWEALSVTFTREETSKLLKEVNWVYNTGINDIFLAALGLALKDWVDIQKICIWLEGHGREEIIGDIIISRTVGWFTVVFPVILDMTYSHRLSYFIKHIKETLHQVPHRGMGYGILRYLTPGTAAEVEVEPQITFNYLGEFGQEKPRRDTAGLFEFSRLNTGDNINPHLKPICRLNVSGIIAGGRLRFTFAYSGNEFEKAFIEGLKDAFQKNLVKIIQHCSNKRKTRQELTPSDLDYQGFTSDELDALQDYFSEKKWFIENIYPLSPMQEGMLFHTQFSENAGVYFEQASYRVQGRLDIDMVKKSLQQLVQRYEILRTVLLYEKVKRPLQVVLKNCEPELVVEDLTRDNGNLSDEEKEKIIQQFKEKDIRRYFKMEKSRLMRVTVLRLDESQYHLTWSFHHILIDGWCVGIVISDFLKIYQSLMENRSLQLPQVIPYGNYIRWLERQDMQKSKVFWQNYLEGYDRPVFIPSPLKNHMRNVPYKNAEMVFYLSRERTNALNSLARENHVTLNVALLTLWAILLGKYNMKTEVVFGMVVSGRPPEIPGIESMVGLFINTVPIRIHYEENSQFLQLLQKVHTVYGESNPHHIFPLAEIQALSSLKQNLFDHIVVYENYPISIRTGSGTEPREGRVHRAGSASALKISRVNIFEQSSYDLNIIFIPGARLRIKVKYNGNVYTDDVIHAITKQIDTLSGQITRDHTVTIAELNPLSNQERKELYKSIRGNRVPPGSLSSTTDTATDERDKMKIHFNF